MSTATPDRPLGPDHAVDHMPPWERPTRRVRFEGLDIEYSDEVLEPRAWTGVQSSWAAKLLTDDVVPPGPVLELCSGAGHIGLAAVAATSRRLVQVDLSRTACRMARRNAVRARMTHRVDVRCGDMTSVLLPHERFSLVIADPPYVTSASVGDHPDDPVLAIDGGADGLDLLERVLVVSAGALADRGVALVQARGRRQLAELARRAEHIDSPLGLVDVREVDDRRAIGLWALEPARPSSDSPRTERRDRRS
jgi:methylase of polypeptide subunit release factors